MNKSMLLGGQAMPVGFRVAVNNDLCFQHNLNTRKTQDCNDHAQLIDFNNFRNNQFLVVNQFTIQGTKMNRRPDVVVFINGLPIAVIELKNPSNEQTDVWDAFNQLQTYKDEISDLFVFNEALVVSDGWTARIGSLTANKERFMPWRTIKNEDDKPLLEYELEKMVKGFFDPKLLPTSPFCNPTSTISKPRNDWKNDSRMLMIRSGW